MLLIWLHIISLVKQVKLGHVLQVCVASVLISALKSLLLKRSRPTGDGGCAERGQVSEGGVEGDLPFAPDLYWGGADPAGGRCHPGLQDTQGCEALCSIL